MSAVPAVVPGRSSIRYTVTPALLQQESPTPLSPEPAKAWMQEHEAAVHAPDEATRRDIERWLMGYRKTLPPPPYELVQEEGVEQAVVSPAAILGILITATPVGRSCRGRTVHTG